MRPASNPRLTTVDRPAATEPTAAAPPRMGWRGDLVTVLLAAWLIAGLFIDGWAHTTRPQLETSSLPGTPSSTPGSPPPPPGCAGRCGFAVP